MRTIAVVAIACLCLWLGACGSEPDTGPPAERQAGPAAAVPPAGDATDDSGDPADDSGDSAGQAGDEDPGERLLARLQELEAQARRSQEEAADADAGMGEQKARIQELSAAMRALAEAGADPEKRAAAMARVKTAQQAVREAGLRADSQRRAALAEEKIPEAWRQARRSERDGEEADLLVQLGDIDNLGYGWPEGFDPFSGESTPVHSFPFLPEDDDPDGTDRIMVVSGHTGQARGRRDGYSQQSHRPDNQPRPLVLEFDPSGIEVRSVLLQLFVDDFQPGYMGSHYRVLLDGREADDITATINALNQTGPIGKLLNIQLLPEFHDLIADGRLEIDIDDPHNDAGDGFAFDFARLLINPKGFRYTGSVRGLTYDASTGKPLAGVLVSAGNVRQAVSGEDGSFVLEDVPAGLVVTTASKPGYEGDQNASDLKNGESLTLLLTLTPRADDTAALAEQLQRERKVDLYGIYFDTAQATLKPESEATLRQVLGVLQEDPELRLVIAGHTDSEGGDDYNQGLSERRAESVVRWLVDQGVSAPRLSAEGHGESRPVADNASAEGRALNRRVELRLAD